MPKNLTSTNDFSWKSYLGKWRSKDSLDEVDERFLIPIFLLWTMNEYDRKKFYALTEEEQTERYLCWLLSDGALQAISAAKKRSDFMDRAKNELVAILSKESLTFSIQRSVENFIEQKSPLILEQMKEKCMSKLEESWFFQCFVLRPNVKKFLEDHEHEMMELVGDVVKVEVKNHLKSVEFRELVGDMIRVMTKDEMVGFIQQLIDFSNIKQKEAFDGHDSQTNQPADQQDPQ